MFVQMSRGTEIITTKLFVGIIVGIIAGLGITAGVHRYYTHRTFKAVLPMQIFLLILYAMAGHVSTLN